MLLLFLTFRLFFRGLGKLVLRTVCGAAESAKGFDNHP